MDKNRRELIEESLDRDLFRIIDTINVKEDENDFSSTEKLANILDGYITKVDNLQFDAESEEFEVLESNDIEIEVDEDDIITSYSNRIHSVDEDTFGELLENTLEASSDTIDFELEKISTNIEINDEELINMEDEVTIAVDEEIKNDNISVEDFIKIDNSMSTDDNNESKFEIIDFVLICAVIVLVLILLYIMMRG